MDIYDFFRSPDVVDHCRKLGHLFDPIEMAAIIDRSEKPIRVKLVAYQELIDLYPDMPFHESVQFRVNTGLHDYLRELIEYTRTMLRVFLSPKRGQSYRILSLDADLLSADRITEHSYASIEGLFDSIKGYRSQGRIRSFRVMKKDGKRAAVGFADFDSDLEITDIEIYGMRSPGRLQHLFINIPTPFQNGDIVSSVAAPDTALLICDFPAPQILSGYVSGQNQVFRHDTDVFVYSVNHGLRRSGFRCAPEHGGGYAPACLQYFRDTASGQYQFLAFLRDYFKKTNYNPNLPEPKEIQWLSEYTHALEHLRKWEAELEQNREKYGGLLDSWNEAFGRKNP